MKELDFPIEANVLLRKKIRLKKELLESGENWVDIKIAVLGGSTTNEVVDQLELFLLNQGIKPEFYQSGYGKYYEDALFGNGGLDVFSPDIVYIHTNWRNINQFPSLYDSEEAVQKILESEYKRFESIWKSIEDRFGCPIIQNNFDRPDYRLLGNRDIWDVRGRSNFVSRLNQMVYRFAGGHENFYINDIDYIAACTGLDKWGSPAYWHMYKYICSLEAVPVLAANLANIIKSIYGKNKKLLAVDLDNTIWGGVVGDDGAEGLDLGMETPKGEAFSAIQSYIKKLKEIGVVLAVDSKNDYQNAVEGLHHPDSVLTEEDFVAIEANWEPKDGNLLKIAGDVSLGTDSFVFMDDNPAERDIIMKNVPGVSVPRLNKPEDFIRLIDRGGYFETTILSEDDQKKTRQYKARALAKKAETSYADYDEYLQGLDMKAEIKDFEDIYIQRIAQLTNKSNQFNLTTLRCTEDDIRSMKKSGHYICLYGRLYDKFGDNGIVAVSVGEIVGDEAHIRLWVMSCRVLKRGMEDAMMNVFVKKAEACGCKRIVGYYFSTAKNAMVKGFYAERGFSLVGGEKNGDTVWGVKIEEYLPRVTRIIIE